MTFWNCIRIALVALRLNALRSFLTMLGIIIGITSVIVMVSVSSGAQQQVENLISSLGTNILRVRPGSSRLGGRLAGAGTATPFSEKDLKVIQSRFHFIEGVSGSIDTSAQAIAGGLNWQTRINGVHKEYIDIRSWVIEEGRSFTEQEVRSGGKVALLGKTVVEHLFGNSNPVGARIRIKNVPFSVIGVLQEKGQSSYGRDQDDMIMIPISTARLRIIGRTTPTISDEVGRVTLQISASYDLKQAQNEIEEFLREYRKIVPGADDDFTVRNYAEFVRTRTETLKTMGLLLASTAAIALIVGGIGIMNIMLVSVTERTREIGIRLAVGAQQRDILRQFLVEAVTLCVVGSLFGMVFGIATTMFIANLGQWPVLIKPLTIIIAIGAAAFIGVFFGYYPARKASQMNPIDALRHE
jgi:putative ABC transport system permease protein